MRHDIESCGFTVPHLLKRRRGWLGLLLLVMLPLSLLTLIHTSPPARERVLGGELWVKDSMYPATSALASTTVQAAAAGEPTLAVNPSLDKLTKLVLFVTRFTRDQSFTVPNDAKQRQKLLDPDTDSTVRWLERDGLEEARQFRASPRAWADSHLPPLIVFSKTYCPYSKRAKALLAGLQAHPLVIEVDLRNDDVAVKAAMTHLTGHSTFPAVVLSGKLLGGSDDLYTLDSELHVLSGMLSAAGALKPRT